MEQFKPAQVIMLLTNNYTTIFKDIVDNKLYLSKDIKGKWDTDKEWFNSYNKTRYQPQHLYIISDDKIEDGDLHITSDHSGFGFRKYKIIATTDTSLKIFAGKGDICDLYYNLPQPSQQFIEKYIEEYNKGNIITDILVEYDVITLNEDWSQRPVVVTNDYKLKINPKDNTITIKKLKDNWNREELKVLFKKHEKDVIKYINGSGASATPSFNDKWIEENL